ncbi:MAG: phosphodiester glycosidase family protein, partial [Lentisphaeria bacterium]|nr:phosphodiester glycosidase family protein [Lentisphaeria bacterium]
LMKRAGAWDAINMDGGGSTTMCYWDFAKQAPVILSKHAGNATRRVGGNIGIYIEPSLWRPAAQPQNKRQ